MQTILKIVTYVINITPLRFLYFKGRVLGRLILRLDSKHREIVEKNLKIAFGDRLGDEEFHDLKRKIFENMGINFLEFMKVPWLRQEDINGYIECEGINNLEGALKKGKGLIVLMAHMGNWEMLGAYLALAGFELNVVVRDLDNATIDIFSHWMRSRQGNRIISKNRSMRELLRVLKGGGIVALLLDQNVTWSEGAFVDFFGRLACTNKGAALLAVASGAPVVPTFIVREGLVHKVIVENEVEIVNSGSRRTDVMENTYRFTKEIENVIKRYPEQWFWVHQRWKSRPEDDPRKGTKLEAPVKRKEK